MGFFLVLYATTTERLIALDRSSNTKGSVTKSVGFGPFLIIVSSSIWCTCWNEAWATWPKPWEQACLLQPAQRVKFVSGAPSKLSGPSGCRLRLLTLNSSANIRRDDVASTTRCLDMGKPSEELICQNPPTCSTSSACGGLAKAFACAFSALASWP